jgi:hypothetical protein
MEHLSNLLSSLDISRPSQNLRFINFDPHHAFTRHLTSEHNPAYYYCQSLITTALLTYSFYFSVTKIRSVLNNYRRSQSDPAAAESFLLRYDVEPFEIIKDEHYYFALEYVTNLFRPKWLIHPVHFTDLRWYPWKTDTSAERPFTTSPEYREIINAKFKSGLIPNGRLNFSNLYSEIFVYCRKIIHDIKNGVLTTYPDSIQMHVKPALVKADEPDKVRSVWGVPKYFIFCEAMFFWPLFSHYFTVKDTPLLWNYESLNGGWSRLNTEYYAKYSNYKPVFNIDWSEYDMRVYFSMWQDILDKVKTYFCLCGKYCPTTLYPDPKTDPSRLHNLWNWLATGYFNMKCASPLGRVYQRTFAGMPSGIFCTQFFDSFYNGVMLICCLRALNHPIPEDFFMKLMGDDALFGLLINLPVSQWADFLELLSAEALRRFNSRLSTTKCKIAPSIQGASVLGYSNWNGWPLRDEEELLARLLHPKTLRDTPSRLMARCIGIYFASSGSKRIRHVTKHIYDELKHQGHVPTTKGLASLYDPIGIRLTDEDLQHFPSETEVIARLCRPSSRAPELQAAYWNRDHFIFEAGIAQHDPS